MESAGIQIELGDRIPRYKTRRCKHKKCRTLLNPYNPNSVCFIHIKDYVMSIEHDLEYYLQKRQLAYGMPRGKERTKRIIFINHKVKKLRADLERQYRTREGK